MRMTGQVLRTRRWRSAARTLFVTGREVALWVGAVLFLEAWGATPAPHDGADVLGLTVASLLGLLFTRLARRGWMPLTRRAARAVAAAVRSSVARLSTRHAVVLRLPPGSAPPAPDRSLLPAAVVLSVLVAGVLAAGPHVLDGLAALRARVSYSLYLLALALVWAVLGGTLVGGLLAAARSRRARARRPAGRRGGLGRAARLAAWGAVLVAVAALPGALTVFALFALAFVQGALLHVRPPATYLLCHRDREGRLRGLPVHEYVRRLHGILLLGLLLATALGQGHRLLLATLPGGPLALTQALGLLASVAALRTAFAAGAWFLRLAGHPGDMPETPLVPTLWIREGTEPPTWARLVEGRGWRVARSREQPTDGYDLVLGPRGEADAFRPRPEAADEENAFLLERRFHVVKRRQFWRRFRGLYKEAVASPRPPGSGYVFCPHVWLVPGLVRDADEAPPGERPPGSLLSARVVGRPYAQVFPPRLRRYLGTVLRDLRIDLVYWEDAVGWADLRRVLGVAFEVHDQGRAPLVERHFLGVPRVRIVIQDEEEVAGGGPSPPAAEEPPGIHARVLLILRDRGGGEQEVAPPAPGTRRRVPVPV